MRQTELHLTEVDRERIESYRIEQKVYTLHGK